MGYAGLSPEDPREIGPYQLLGQLGSGGMGQVFLGMSAGGRPIAVKVIRTELATDPEFRARFRREVAAAQKVSGLFTALVVDADLDSPTPWLATAYVAGPSLTEAVRDHGPLPVCTVLALAAGLAESLSAIHTAGVVHGDLKPSNVLLAEDGPRVIDFGISQAAEASAASVPNMMIGSPGYMSPEQVLGAEISPASDMFSLGAVLTFAATGQGPFGSGSSAAVIYRLVNSPASLGKVPRELRRLIGSCLAKHPSDRPTARDLLAQVGEIQPSPGWLSESILASFAQDRSGGGAGNLLALAGAASGQPRPGAAGRRGRHRISRPVASACLSGGLVAASAVAVFALIGAGHDTPQTPGLQPQAGAGSVATAPSSASNAPATQPSSSAGPRISVAPNAYLTPSLSKFVSPSLAPTIGPSSTAGPGTSASASSSSSASSSASASASASSSASTSPSSSASASASSSASASTSPTDSTSPSSSASASTSPTDSTSPTSAPTDSTSPTSAPTDSTSPTDSSSPSDTASAAASATSA